MPVNNFLLVLSDGTEIQFAVGSTILNLIGVYATFAEVDYVREKLTEENLKGATFNGQTVENIVPMYVTVNAVKPGDNLEVYFHNTEKSAIDIMKEQITELQEAIVEIAG